MDTITKTIELSLDAEDIIILWRKLYEKNQKHNLRDTITLINDAINGALDEGLKGLFESNDLFDDVYIQVNQGADDDFGSIVSEIYIKLFEQYGFKENYSGGGNHNWEYSLDNGYYLSTDDLYDHTDPNAPVFLGLYDSEGIDQPINLDGERKNYATGIPFKLIELVKNKENIFLDNPEKPHFEQWMWTPSEAEEKENNQKQIESINLSIKAHEVSIAELKQDLKEFQK